MSCNLESALARYTSELEVKNPFAREPIKQFFPSEPSFLHRIFNKWSRAAYPAAAPICVGIGGVGMASGFTPLVAAGLLGVSSCGLIESFNYLCKISRAKDVDFE